MVVPVLTFSEVATASAKAFKENENDNMRTALKSEKYFRIQIELVVSKIHNEETIKKNLKEENIRLSFEQMGT